MRRPLAALALFGAFAACGAREVAPPPEVPVATAAPDAAAAPEPGTERGPRDFVTAFLRARMARNERLARTWLSPTALEQYRNGEGGLGLMETAASRFTGWDLVSIEAADASSYEVKVTIREQPAGGQGERSFTETLFVGPGPDLQGRQQPWIIRGAMREGSGG
jgi:hypothetical protein